MTTDRGLQLAQAIRGKFAELKAVGAGVDEAVASRAPAGRWSPKEVLSHLCGRGETGHLPLLEAFLKEDTPDVDISPENPFYTSQRAAMTFAQLLTACEANYERIAKFASGLSDAQMQRKAHIPQLKDSPLGEYPTLENMIHGLGVYHVQMHIEHLQEILRLLAE
ncbi:MAG: DinB family protein [Acidobacteriota bacterium]